MYASASQLPVCYNCLRLMGQRQVMDQISEHIFHCPACNSTKELVAFPVVRSSRRWGLWLLSAKAVASGLAIGGTLYSAALPLLARVPASEIVGPVVLAGYLYGALRLTLGSK